MIIKIKFENVNEICQKRIFEVYSHICESASLGDWFTIGKYTEELETYISALIDSYYIDKEYGLDFLYGVQDTILHLLCKGLNSYKLLLDNC